MSLDHSRTVILSVRLRFRTETRSWLSDRDPELRRPAELRDLAGIRPESTVAGSAYGHRRRAQCGRSAHVTLGPFARIGVRDRRGRCAAIGEVLARSETGMEWAESTIAGLDLAAFPMLGGICPYEDSMFNSVQRAMLVNELAGLPAGRQGPWVLYAAIDAQDCRGRLAPVSMAARRLTPLAPKSAAAAAPPLASDGSEQGPVVPIALVIWVDVSGPAKRTPEAV